MQVKGLPRNKLSQLTNHRDAENAERRNREDFCISFGIFFYLEVPKCGTAYRQSHSIAQLSEP